MPYISIKSLMIDEHLSNNKDGTKTKWNFIIENNSLRVHANSQYSKDISSFFNTITPFIHQKDRVSKEDLISNHEGERQNKLHKTIERDRKFIDQIKSKYKSIDPYLHCQICGFSSLEKYGTIGDGCIEAHHIKPLSELTEKTQTKEEDIIFLCPNCHRVIHSHNPILKVSDVKNALKQLRN